MVQELTKIALFQGKQIRRIFLDNEWWFSVIDIIALLTESDKPRDYWHTMKRREKKESNDQLSAICRQLKLEASDGKKYTTDCSNVEGLFRIIQSIPSPKAEPLKLWIAKVAKERLDEIENPELGIQRARMLYEKRVIQKNGLKKEYAVLKFVKN